MRIERYYSSVKEEVSPLADDAFTLLDAEDYVGFFKACGPNYVRSLRRAQEVTAIFKMTSSSRETAKQFAAGLKVSGYGASVSASFAAKSKFKQITSSLEIKILGFGLGLSQEGSETLVATSLEEYNEVMKFAFKSMTRNEDAHHIGMVYGMEVSPWVHNTAFQVAAKMQDENIVVPLPRSLIPKAYPKTKGDSTVWANTDEVRDKFRCKELAFQQDKYGYCCEEEALFDYVNQAFSPVNATERVCRPSRNLDKSLVKDNMANNGEFVARLDSSMRYRLVQLSQAEKCISAANSIPKRFDFHILKAQDTVKYDRAIEVSMTLFDLKRAVDPVGDFSIIKHLSQELDEWIEMYYSPCMAALYGTNVGTTPDTDVSFFMAYPWHSHKECMYLACLAPNMRWDRNAGGCTAGLITGPQSTNYDGDNNKCASDPDKTSSDSEQCKHDSGLLQTYHSKVKACWDASTVIGSGQVDYFIEHFCLPQLTGNKVDEATKDQMITNAGSCEGLNYQEAE